MTSEKMRAREMRTEVEEKGGKTERKMHEGS